MKKIKWTILSVAMIGLFGCDVIDNPFPDGGGNGGGGDEIVKRKILIEEFTGHRCNNCPDAAAEIKLMQASSFGDQILAIAIHAGPPNFVGVNVDFPTDFRTQDGTAWANFFRVLGLPSGMVSRANYSETGNSHMVALTAWAGIANDLKDLPAAFKIEITPQQQGNLASAKVKVEVLRELDNNHKVVVVLTEDNIVSPQRMPDYSRNPDYVHMFVFRKSFNGLWGDAAFANGDLPGETWEEDLSIPLEPDWNVANCNIIAYVYNERTMEIMQAEQVSLIP
jgi:hypothetical protein